MGPAVRRHRAIARRHQISKTRPLATARRHQISKTRRLATARRHQISKTRRLATAKSTRQFGISLARRCRVDIPEDIQIAKVYRISFICGLQSLKIVFQHLAKKGGKENLHVKLCKSEIRLNFYPYLCNN